MASQNIPTPVCDLAIYLYLYWTPAADVWKGDLQRLLGLITVVIPLDRFVARDSFQYIRLNEFPMSVRDLAIILDSCGQCLEGGLATPTRTHYSCNPLR